MVRKTILVLGLVVFCLGGTLVYQYKMDNKIKEAPPEYVFTYAENQPEGYPTTLGAYRFANLVEERTKGRIKIRVHSGGSLGDEVSAIEQLQFGGLDFARASIMTMGEFDDKMNVLQLPYLYQDAEHMWSVLDGEIGQEFMVSLENHGLIALSWYDAGARHIYTKEAVRNLDDLHGKRIRVAESGMMKTMISSLGAIPVPMAYSDVFSALETGEIYGAENNWSSYTFTDHYKVAGYMVLDEHNRIPELQLVSQTTWQKLSIADQKIIRDCATESAEYERMLWVKQEELSQRIAEQYGVVTTKLDVAQQQRFREAVQPVYDEFSGDYQAVIDRISKCRDSN